MSEALSPHTRNVPKAAPDLPKTFDGPVRFVLAIETLDAGAVLDAVYPVVDAANSNGSPPIVDEIHADA